MGSKRYIPVLITVALLALIGLQAVWLFLVSKHKHQELVDKTREAVIQTATRLQREEDSKLIINNMDSLLLTENIIGPDSGSLRHVFVSNVKNKLKIDTIHGKHTLIVNDSAHSTTVVKVGNGKNQKIMISSSSIGGFGNTNTQSYTYTIDDYETAAADHKLRMNENAQKIIEQEKKLEEHLLKLKEREKQLAEKVAEKKSDPGKEREAIQKEEEAIQKERAAIQKQMQAIQTARLVQQNAEQKVQIASIEINNGKQEAELEKAAIAAEAEAQKAQEIALESQLKVKKLQKKAGELQTLFFKMAVSSEEAQANIDSLFTYERVKKLLKEELVKQGVDLDPAFGIYFFPNRHPAKVNYHVICNTPGFAKMPPPLLAMPFADPIYDGALIMKVNYASTMNFVLKQMAGLLSLSLFITILVGFVMIYLFRRMLSQEKLHQLKNDLINNMAHELKTPIATISLAVDGISNPAIKNDNEKFDAYTSILKEENKKLNTHVERVLQSALLEKGELQLEKKEIELNALLRNCLDTYQLQIQNKKAKVDLIMHETIFVTGDPFHLANAFTNLLDNALKYSKENCEIEISLVKNRNSIEIQFKDNGIGIPNPLQTKVFEKFYRVQGGNIHDVKGSGLGLSYVKSIIEAHGGTIALISEESKGSEFIIKLNSNVN